MKEQIAFLVNKENKNQGEAAGGEARTVETVTSEDEKKHRENAVKLIQQELVIGQLSDDLGVEVSEEDLNKELKAFAQLLGGDLKKLKKEWAESGALLRLHSRMRRERTLDQVIDQVKVTEEMVDRSELTSDN